MQAVHVRSVRAGATDRPSQYRSHLPSLCPPAKLGRTPCWAQHSRIGNDYSKGGDWQLPSPSIGFYPHQQRRKRLAPNLHSTLPFSLDPPAPPPGRSCYARRVGTMRGPKKKPKEECIFFIFAISKSSFASHQIFAYLWCFLHLPEYLFLSQRTKWICERKCVRKTSNKKIVKYIFSRKANN